MTFKSNAEFVSSNTIIAVSVGKSSGNQLHNKLLINFSGYIGELHLEFHHRTKFSSIFEEPHLYIWENPKSIPESRLKSLAARCIKIIKNIEMQVIPYTIGYKGKRKFNTEGFYASYTNGDEYGVTCATFILTIFDSVGIDLLDWKNWQERPEDTIWFDNIIRMIELHRRRGNIEMSDEHLINLKSERNTVKIRPEEVLAACYCNNLPINFICCSSLGSHIRNFTVSLS